MLTILPQVILSTILDLKFQIHTMSTIMSSLNTIIRYYTQRMKMFTILVLHRHLILNLSNLIRQLMLQTNHIITINQIFRMFRMLITVLHKIQLSKDNTAMLVVE